MLIRSLKCWLCSNQSVSLTHDALQTDIPGSNFYAGPKLLYIPPGFARYDYTRLLPKLASKIPQLQKIVLLTDISHKYHWSQRSHEFLDYETFIEQQQSSTWSPDHSISPHDIVNVQFTSGSTGIPKSVALSHYNIMNCGRYIWLQTRMTDKDRICCPVPLFHSFGMIVGEFDASSCLCHRC